MSGFWKNEKMAGLYLKTEKMSYQDKTMNQKNK